MRSCILSQKNDCDLLTVMKMTLSIPRDDLFRFIRQAAPIRIHLTSTDDDSKWIELELPEELEMVPGEGVRVTTHGRLRYEVAGMKVPLKIRTATFMLKPTLVTTSDMQERIAFAIDILHGDLEKIPDFIDRGLIHKVNKALTPEASQMVWDFRESLANTFEMPERLEPLGHLALSARGATVLVTDQALELVLDLRAELSRLRERPVTGPPPLRRTPAA